MLSTKINSITDIGGRAKNQDRLYHHVFYENTNYEYSVALISDGVGSLKDSEIASEFIARYLEDFFRKEELNGQDPDDILNTIDSSIKSLHTRLKQIAVERNLELGATLTLLILLKDRYIVCQIGDSKAYILMEGELRKITRDHTIKEKERELLLQCIGRGDIAPSYYTGEIKKDVVFLLASDGLTNTITERRIKDELISESSLEDLLKIARENGEQDNVSVIWIKRNAL